MVIKSDYKGKWKRRYYVCNQRRVTGRCDNRRYIFADAIEGELIEGIRTSLLDQLQDHLLGVIGEEVARHAAQASERGADAERLARELDSLRQRQKRLVRLAAAADDVPEIIDELRANQERIKGLDRALTLATAEPVKPEMATALETAIRSGIAAMRERVTPEHAREVLTRLFPDGLRLEQPAPTAPDGERPTLTVVGGASPASVSVGNASCAALQIGTEAKIPFSLRLAA